ncbi:MAG: hypothetical protein UZ17_ACD001002958 [Acidobacteria bacterium OLB17]|nr:MAG: hypothetical protein UZ17_ACD001002958 [Acidobacteria bacterium OLB17]
MIGLLVLGLMIVWLAIVVVSATWLSRRFGSKTTRVLVWATAFGILLPLPLIDEIVGGYQFRKLCRQHAVVIVDESRARGRTVYLRQIPHPLVPGVVTTPSRQVPAWIPIRESIVDWIDVQTHEVLVSYRAYEARGGWLVRALGISETDGPLTFDPHSCRVNSVELFKRLGISSK